MRPSRVVHSDDATQDLPGAEAVAPGDALIMVTSGTTGDPKGVVLTHAAVEASARATNARLEVDPDKDAWWACLPMAHIGGLSVVTRCLVGGVRFEAVTGFSVDGAGEAIQRGATMTSLVPTALGRLGPLLAAKFRRIVLGGQAAPGRAPPNVTTTYGMTETGSGVVYDGLPLEGVSVRVTGDQGEIAVSGPMLLRAYRDGRDPKDAEGWLTTGDAGEIDAGGRLHVRGRLSEMIISGGENVWPTAVERIVLSHPMVSAAAVAGSPDPEWGERVVAYVVTPTEAPVPAPAALLADLRERVRTELAVHAAPRELVIVDKLPLTALGKIRRDDLKALSGPSARV